MTEDFRGFECIAVVGVGLIGGSLALALRRRGLVRRVVGVGRSRENLEVAQSLGILDAFSQDLAEGVWEADLVVVATPVGAIGPTVAAMREHLAPGTIVTDVGSVKGSVVRECEAALEGVGTFVGGHPIAGTERSGAGAAFAELFDGRLTVLTPTDRTAPEALAAVRALWEAAGARVALMDPDLHDRILAGVSHLPHMVAYALMDAVGAMEREDASDYLGFSAGGLRDFTRVAGSDPVMWRDIALANRAALLRALDANAGSLARLRRLVEQGDGPGLRALFAEARDRREALKRLEEEQVVSEPKRLGPARRVAGDLVVPGDKSVSHRAVLFGALAEGTSRVRGALDGDDNRRTLAATAAMGARHRRDGDALVIEGVGLGGLRAPEGPLDMGNSGTTTRLLLGVLAGQSFEATLFGDPSLSRRPMRRVTEPLRQMGADIRGAEDANFLPLEVRGGSLHGIRYDLPVASAQVHGALVLAGLRAEGETIVTLPGPARDHTDRMLRAMGAAIETDAGLRRTVVRRTERLRPLDFDVPGDLSSAAFFLVAALLVPDSEVVLRGVGVNPTRTGLLGVLRTMGARIEEVNLAVRSGEPVADLIVRMEPLMGVDVGGEVIPRLIDEIPILAVAATQAEGTTTIRDAGELRVKESDRIAAVAEELNRMGARITERPDGMVIEGPTRLRGAAVASRGDHRMAMSLAVAALVAEGETTIDDPDCVDVSFPGFWDALDGVTES